MKKLFDRLSAFIGIISVVALLVSWGSGFINPKTYWPASFPSLIFPYIFIFCALLSFWGLVRKKRKVWILIVCLFFTLGTFRASFFNISLAPSTGKYFSLMTHNVGSSLPSNKKPDFLFYKKNSIDILCLQEWNERTQIKIIKDSLLRAYRYHTLSETINPRPIFSVYPIIHQGQLVTKAKGNGITWADIALTNDTIRVYNVHLASNRISSQTEELMHTDDITSSNFIQRVKRVFVRYRNALLIRVDQSKQLRLHLLQSPYPVIVVGDFNDTPTSFTYRALHKGLNDAFQRIGTGMAYTYAGSLPFLAIDHVLYDDRLSAGNILIKREAYSDHYPVKVIFSKKIKK